MRKIYLTVCVVIILVLLGCGQDNLTRSNPLDPQYNGSSLGTATYTGKVRSTDGNTFLVNARVTLSGNNFNKQAYTNDTGDFLISDIPMGQNLTRSVTAAFHSGIQDTFTATNSTVYDERVLTPKPPTIEDSFETYTPVAQLSVPWFVSITASGGANVMAGGTSGSYELNLSKPDASGAAYVYRVITDNSSYKISAKVQSNMATYCFRLALCTNSNEEIAGIGFTNTSIVGMQYQTKAEGTKDDTTQSLGTQGGGTIVFWLLEVEADGQENKATFTVKDAVTKSIIIRRTAVLNNSGTAMLSRARIIMDTQSPAQIPLSINVDEFKVTER
ncbi:MAG: hypothetical protein A2452_04900 [Candidatus Firestonebacteria bacterium RIFOXYC2_FULL_39_67]|nr:MAG: hypothetical protein A2536_11435 [Candidatus Firestonebacteria bacterium RIFOXYD2_FULL_39_29]OGF55814.1 MAG: hypothetical protein A2452_04900 [Candidatus Firestonebacteria bacterium RIFOXYC2_FULL_39_67]OGF57788.1 MAG: hypothetical protein A2497_04080 [Candidatus Firestonebacteria bacterium RifOxyC12_full_39_7]